MIANTSSWPSVVLKFWFEELSEKEWFMSSDTLDATISERFGAAHRELRESTVIPAPVNGKNALASVLVLDQFSRNMFRGTSNAFAYDELALKFSKQAMQFNLTNQLSEKQCVFLYMPFMHSEKLDDQQIALTLFSGKAKESAIKHCDLIKRFGRFPHRNEVLGRESTADELEYLKDGKRFGQ